MENELAKKFLTILSTIPDRELFIVMSRTIAFNDLEKIAKVLKLTPERVRQIEQKTLNSIDKKVKEQLCTR